MSSVGAGIAVSSLIVNSGIKDLKKNKRKVIGLEEMFYNTDSPDAGRYKSKIFRRSKYCIG